MSATVLYMSMSLDGFIAGPNEGPGNGLGDGGHRLHDWYFGEVDAGREPGAARRSGVNGQIIEEFMATGAMVAGRGTFEPAGGWGGDHHDGVPIWVFSRHEPGIDVSQWPLVTYVDDVTTAMTEAKRAAGDRNVGVHGAATAQLALAAGVARRAGAPRGPRPLRPGAAPVRQHEPGADRAGAHPGPRGRGCDPHPLPRPPLTQSTIGPCPIACSSRSLTTRMR